MNQDNDAYNLNADDSENTKLPQGLNVLTILTFIGCGLVGLFTLCAPMINDFFLKYLDKQLASGKDFSASELAKIEKGKDAIELAQQHMIPLMTTGLIGVALCLVGALWMRKLRKDGFWLYVSGEITPVIRSGLTRFLMVRQHATFVLEAYPRLASRADGKMAVKRAK